MPVCEELDIPIVVSELMVGYCIKFAYGNEG
jgi:hypothetical protein